MTRNRKLLTMYLKRLLREIRSEDKRCPKVIQRAGEYLALLKTAPTPNWKQPRSLNRCIAELRHIARNRRLGASARLRSLSCLMLLEGAETNVDDPRATLIRQALCIPAPTRPDKRDATRRRALQDAKRTLADDIRAGRIRTLEDAVTHLRLPEMKSVITDVDLEKQRTAQQVLEGLTRKYKNENDVEV